jgi:hypothetical protein
MPTLTRCRILNTGTQSIPGSNTLTTLAYSNVDVGSTAGMWDLTNNRINITVSGLYAIDLYLGWPGATSAIKSLRLRLNGARIREDVRTGTGTLIGHPITAHLWLTAGDYIDSAVTQSGASAVTTDTGQGENCLSVYQLR